jgi:hypothetical protein
VAEFFPVNNKPAVPYGMKKAFLCTLFVNPGFQSIQDKDTVFLNMIHHAAFDIGVTFFYQGSLNIRRLQGSEREFFKLVYLRPEQEPIWTAVLARSTAGTAMTHSLVRVKTAQE